MGANRYDSTYRRTANTDLAIVRPRPEEILIMCGKRISSEYNVRVTRFLSIAIHVQPPTCRRLLSIRHWSLPPAALIGFADTSWLITVISPVHKCLFPIDNTVFE